MNLSKLSRRKHLNKAFRQIWLDAFDEACKTANKNMELTKSRKWSQEDQEEVEFCRAKYRSYLVFHNLKENHRGYDRYLNGMKRNL